MLNLNYLLNLQKRVQQVKTSLPERISKVAEKRNFRENLAQLNRDNLLKGLDGEGNNMPSYRDPDYANFKTSINPRNRGFWDLHLTGQFHRGITVTIVKNKIKFKQRYKNKKIEWLDGRLKDRFGNNRALGVTKEQYSTELGKILPQIKVDIIIYLRNGKNGNI